MSAGPGARKGVRALRILAIRMIGLTDSMLRLQHPSRAVTGRAVSIWSKG
jgi:hypothetical protein